MLCYLFLFYRLVEAKSGDRVSDLIDALKDEVRFQKQVLKRKGSLKVTGTIEELVSTLKSHLGDFGDDLPTDDQDEPPPPKQQRAAPFSFETVGQWVAVYFDDQFYIGQVFIDLKLFLFHLMCVFII